ncbi:MAG: HD domain-containing protein [Dictyoglomus sp.]|nr:HD domain-containing protein [Dictyoglomus sp.]MDW8189188.1 HD domain-containing protein [Dictyoglomus sp.]
MKDFLENIKHGVIVINSNNKIIKCNSVFEKLSGYQREEVENKLLVDDILGDLNLLEERDFETFLRTKKGEILKVFVNIFPLSENLTVLSLYDIYKLKETYNNFNLFFNKFNIPLVELDVSELFQYFKTLKKVMGKELYRYFDVHPELVYEVAKRIKIVNVNQSFKKEFSDFDFRNFQENIFLYLNESSLDIIKEEINKFYNGNLNLNFEVQAYNLLGKPRDLNINILPIENERVLVSIVDVTQRRDIERKLYASIHKLNNIFTQVIMTLSSIMEYKDSYTAYHQKRVSELSQEIAKEMNLPKDKIEAIKTGALLHDIGKISIPGEILNKPGRLSVLEMNIVKTHPINGYNMLKNIDFPSEVLEIVEEHHERLDGSGYPEGLKDKEISLPVRIVSVADVVEAMVSHRPYRPPLGIDKALKEIEENKGTKYDENVVEVCIKLFRERGFKFSL